VEKRGYFTLTRLTVISSRTRYHDDDTTFSVFSYWRCLCHVREDLSDEIDCSADVDVHYEFKVGEGEWCEVAV
jgi:hypothetical protein